MNTEGSHNYVVVKNIPLRNKFKEREKKIIEKNIMSSYKQCICIEKVMKGINTLLEDVAEWISLFNLNKLFVCTKQINRDPVHGLVIN